MILFFSGTGNTSMAARRLGRRLGEAVIDISGSPLELSLSGRSVIWCFPTYSWGMPPVVAEYMSRVSIKNADRVSHFMVTTCGDDMGYTDQQWRRQIEIRGWHAKAAFSVIMPNSYVCMKGFDVDTSDVASRKLEQAEETLKLIAEDIKAFTRGDKAVNRLSPQLTRGGFPWIKSHLIYPWFVRHAMSPKPFHTTATCIGCGLCASKCPCNNIVMQKDDGLNEHAVPHWNGNCAMCLRCYHICPNHAVAYGRATEGKGQYMNPSACEI